MTDRKRHPSGRRLNTAIVKRAPVWRVPDHGYVIPRLRDGNQRTEAVGFYVHQVREDEDAD